MEALIEKDVPDAAAVTGHVVDGSTSEQILAEEILPLPPDRRYTISANIGRDVCADCTTSICGTNKENCWRRSVSTILEEVESPS